MELGWDSGREACTAPASPMNGKGCKQSKETGIQDSFVPSQIEFLNINIIFMIFISFFVLGEGSGSDQFFFSQLLFFFFFLVAVGLREGVN